MARYYRQRDTFRCGPVAIFNTLKCLGFNIGFKDTKDYICDICNCATKPNDGGTDPIIIRNVLKSFGIKHTMKKHVTIKDVDYQLKNNKALILRYSWRAKDGYWHGHYYLITEKKNKMYMAVNLFSNRTASWRHRKTIVDTLISSSNKDEWCAWAWIINK